MSESSRSPQSIRFISQIAVNLVARNQDNLYSNSPPPFIRSASSLQLPLPPPVGPASIFKSARGSGDIGKWDGRIFKLELVFISCLISWRLSPWLSAANLFDLSKECGRGWRAEHEHIHTHSPGAVSWTTHTCACVPQCYTAKLSVGHWQICSFKRASALAGNAS